MQKTELCYGVIKRTAPSGKFYGWVTVFSQPLYEDVFFHFSSLDPSVMSLSVGDECSFHLVESERRETGKGVMAENIKILPKGTLKIANLRQEVYVGVIIEELREPKPGEEPRGGMVQVTKFKRPQQRNHGRMAKIGDTFAFSGRDLHKGLIGPQLHQFLRKGDEIEFQLYDCLVPRYVDRVIRATRVCLEKLAGKRYHGTIDRIPLRHGAENDRAFGWIKFAEPGKEETHFRFDRILSNELPEVGDEVEFGIEYDHMKRPGASRIVFVPKGTCADQLEKYVCEGIVTDGPRLHVLDGERREGHMDRDINHFLGGKIEFQHPKRPPNARCSLPCFLKSKFSPQSSYGRPPSPRLLKGDRVVFNLNIFKKDHMKQYISNIEVTVPTFDYRLVGIVSRFTVPPVSSSYDRKRSRPPKTGIIKVPEPQSPEEVFFHMNECEKPDDIRERTEVEFDVAYNSKKRPVAIRIRKKPKNFLRKFKPLHINNESKVRVTESHQQKSRHRRYYVSNQKKTHEIHSHNMEPSSPFDCLAKDVEVIFDVYRDLFARCDVLKNVRFKNKDIIRSRKRKVASRMETNSERFPRPRRKPKYNKAKDDEGLTSEDGADSTESGSRHSKDSTRQKRKTAKGDSSKTSDLERKRAPKKPPLPQSYEKKRNRSNSKSSNAKLHKSSPERKEPSKKAPTKSSLSKAESEKKRTSKSEKAKTSTQKSNEQPSNAKGLKIPALRKADSERRNANHPKPPTMTKTMSEPRRRGGKRRSVDRGASRFPKSSNKSSRGRNYRRGRGRGSRNSGLQERRKNKDSPAPQRSKKEAPKKESNI